MKKIEIENRFTGSIILSGKYESIRDALEKNPGANLFGADLPRANLSGADFTGADLTRANLFGANLSGADLSGADLPGADLTRADLSWANLSGANLSGADLTGANLSYSYLKRIVSNSARLKYIGFKETKNHWIGYKTFGSFNQPPQKWSIKKGSTIREFVNHDIWTDCGAGVNIGTLNWVKHNISAQNDIWLVHIPKTADIIVPFNSDGKIRVSECKLIEIVN